MEEARVTTDFEVSILMNVVLLAEMERTWFGEICGEVMSFVLNSFNVTCLKTLR